MFPHGQEVPPGSAGARTPAAGGSWRPWSSAWADAAYGPAGFWSREQPGAHFSTGVGAGSLVAEAVAALVPPGCGVVVDVGSGDGALLARLLDLLPGVRLVGVDRRPRPPGLDPRVAWVVDHHDGETGGWRDGGPERWCGDLPAPLVVAHELLDDLPVPVAVRTARGWCEVEVDAGGAERTGGPVGAADAAWLERWWDAGPPGARAEVGRERDAAWAGLVAAASARGGSALAVDYGHVRGQRPPTGSLLAYAAGRQRRPVPDGSVNLTAGVAVDALQAAGTAAGAAVGAATGVVTLLLERQAAILARLADPTGPPGTLASLARRSERAALTTPGRWGGLWWLLQGTAPVR